MKPNVIRYEDRLALPVGEFMTGTKIRGGLDHLLRKVDRSPVYAVLEHLRENLFESYVGGGVVNRHMFKGENDYEDVDILAVAPSREVFDRICKTLSHWVMPTKEALEASLEPGMSVREDYVPPKNPGFKEVEIGDVKFHSISKGTQLYIGTIVPERFELIAQPKWQWRQWYGEEPAVIDLSLKWGDIGNLCGAEIQMPLGADLVFEYEKMRIPSLTELDFDAIREQERIFRGVDLGGQPEEKGEKPPYVNLDQPPEFDPDAMRVEEKRMRARARHEENLRKEKGKEKPGEQ